MDSRRDFIKKAALLSGGAALANVMPAAIQRAFAINPAPGSTFLDAEHIVILMQENRSFDHCFGTLQGVRGFNDPRAIQLPDGKPVWFQTDATGNTYSPFRLNIKDTKVTWMGSLPHSRASQVDANNLGKYDKWLTAKKSGNKQYAAMPLTLGYYNRDDLPFNYAMADAFTICDQNFCSAMTSTTPNRSFFWTGKIMSEEDGLAKANIRNTDFSYGKMEWKTFPELLTENNLPWKFYQNDLSCGGGFVGEERSWLANYGCNLLEFFKAYNVKFSDRNIRALQKQAETLPEEIDKLQEASPSDEATAAKARETIKAKQEVLDTARAELSKWNRKAFEQLSAKEKELYYSAFSINKADPDFRSITELTYFDKDTARKVTVPKGDVLYQFRQDVNQGKLPLVSWLASPQNFSDHPSAPWYGAWYVSEVLDILTKNPEVWKKTIFIVTYDENDGYFDHIPPFSIPDDKQPDTGKCSAGIVTEVEHVRLENEIKQGTPKNQAREGAIGLGFRVPMLIASPWSRGGKVCSEVFDHTSTLQFLETFVNQKFGKQLRLENISEWRRTICGDLTSAFSPYDGRVLEKLPFLDRNKNVENIYNARFKDEPKGFKPLNENDITALSAAPTYITLQEKGTRASCALPYELYVSGTRDADKKGITLKFKAGNNAFGKKSAGSPFTVYAPRPYKNAQGRNEQSKNWWFAVKAGDEISYNWPLTAFENGKYHLRAHGPNGFYREFIGDAARPGLNVQALYEKDTKTGRLTGNLILAIKNNDREAHSIIITDNAYKTGSHHRKIDAGKQAELIFNLAKSHQWYDLSVKAAGNPVFEERLAGRVETGTEGRTDPLMGALI